MMSRCIGDNSPLEHKAMVDRASSRRGEEQLDTLTRPGSGGSL